MSAAVALTSTPGDDASASAAAARVRVAALTELDDLRAVHRLLISIWQPAPDNPPMTPELLRALSLAGNYVAGAFDGSALVGACVGFFAAPERRELHSHIAGVSATVLGRGVGHALKLHQRAWALQQGATTIAWTFDPLVGRNAYFNLVKLAATPTRYLTNFYGSMHDRINGDDDTDRLLLHWSLTDPEVRQASAGSVRRWDAAARRRAGAAVALDRDADGAPVIGSITGDDVLVATPEDIEKLRVTDPATARQWRRALREVLGSLLAEDATVLGFDRAGWYLLTRNSATRRDG
ncbi:GNAT family N-acetyltransferase [Micromonospora sp. WMMD964]|uniref:GNAT family N-acetyltransferase n=1 Tax=Micromonospora sp. WMMD964 TaxID=3016091 RepID=UPI00249BDD1B|nr:GNAT family N-acetyltransferase [Micromonospora sp. WMMD964]WFF00148.1 GNAT family N-acetyltransferase [Micromonospora sp. WMMD964]